MTVPTLAQALQNGPEHTPGPRVVALIGGSTATVAETSYGPITNATGVTPTTGRAVVVTIGGADYAIGWIRA
ncbi:hypothetical protein [Streptomyces sp. NPDC051546]|uniref:hypothetical protein n=1 Tax=Streptomyces sp. NPDC051546 TaxID=3365655 RepID=UPI003796681A